MIEGKNIMKAFDDHILFSNLNFTIETGEFVCFSGPSGVGKTTLLNMIGNIESVDSGDICIDGKVYKTNKEKIKFFGEKVGFLFQNFALIENKTVRDNLNIVRKGNMQGHSIMDALAKVGLEDKIDSKVYTLSGGEQQRIALARLYIKKCDIILADEPTGSLDRENADKVMAILLDLHAKGKTIVLVTHDERIKQVAQREITL